MKNKGLPPSLIQKLSDAVRSYPSIDSLYLFGATTGRDESEFFVPNSIKANKPVKYEIFILVVSETSLGDPLKFREAIQAELEGEVKVYNIHYTCEDFSLQFDTDPFLRQILTPENLVWSDSEWQVPSIIRKRPLEQLIEEWEYRMRKAVFFHEKAAISGWDNDEVASTAFFSEAVWQASAALVWAHFEWKPRNFDLDLCLNLSKSFTSIPDMLLPKATFQSHKIYHFLCHSRTIMLQNTERLLTEDEAEEIFEVTRRFIRKVNAFGIEKIRSRGPKDYVTPLEVDYFDPFKFQQV